MGSSLGTNAKVLAVEVAVSLPTGPQQQTVVQRHGSGTPRSLHIFLAKWSFTSPWRGTALRLLKEGLCHHEWLPPSRRSVQP